MKPLSILLLFACSLAAQTPTVPTPTTPPPCAGATNPQLFVYYSSASAPGGYAWACVEVMPPLILAVGADGHMQLSMPPAIFIPFAATRTDSTHLSIGSNCSGTTPCLVRIGSAVTAFVAPATVTLATGASGPVTVYINAAGEIEADTPITGAITCAGCIAGLTATPLLNSIPLWTWPVTVPGTFDLAGTDNRAILSAAPTLVPGFGVSISQSGSQTMITTEPH